MKLFKYSFFVFVLACISSCEDKLVLYPESVLSEGTFWKTPTDFKQGANRFYFDLPRSQDLTARARESDLEMDDKDDEISSGINLIPSSDGTWSGIYADLRRINNLLQQGEKYGGDVSEIEQFISEAYFFRAYANFELLKKFGRFIIVNSVLDVSSPELSSGRDSRDDCVDQIISDLQRAATGLPTEADISSSDKGRMSQQAANGLLARVALFEGTWQKFRSNEARANKLLDLAINSSTSVMNAREHSLFKNTAALGDYSYRYMFVLTGPESNPGKLTKNDHNEYVIRTKYDYALRQTGGNISHAMSSFHQSATKKLVDMYLCSDGLPIDQSPLYKGGNADDPAIDAEYLNRDLRFKNTFRVPGDTYYQRNNLVENYQPTLGVETLTGYKYAKFVSEEDIETGDESMDTPVLRYAEILLIFAEATFERNGSISDTDLDLSINVVRDRVDMPHLSNSFVTTNGLNMRTEIRRERTVELASEGQRLLDLKRWKTAEIEMPMDMKGVRVTGTDWVVDDTFSGIITYDADGYMIMQPASSRTWAEKNYLFPLPQDELLINPNLEQNPGWN